MPGNGVEGLAGYSRDRDARAGSPASDSAEASGGGGIRRGLLAPFGALQGGVEHRGEQFGGVMQALCRQAQIARLAHDLAAAVHHGLVAHWLHQGPFSQCTQCLFRDAAAPARLGPQRVDQARHSFEEPQVTHEADRRAFHQLVVRIRGERDRLWEWCERHAIEGIEAQRPQVVEKGTSLFKGQRGDR